MPEAYVTCLTAPGQGGISVLRLWGPGSAAILCGLFVSPRGQSLRAAPVGDLRYGTLVSGGEILDEVIVCRLPAAAGECAFEVNCHGGALPARRILEAFERLGARQLSWDDLCERRLRGGELDAIRVEADSLLPHAVTRAAARALLAQGRGALSLEIARVLRQLEEGPEPARARLEALLASARYGLRLTSFSRVGIAGRPNVGKSSLANALLRRDRLIVHERAGTTRDVIEERCDLRGLPVCLVDMAGLRATADSVEIEGVRRAREALRRVDLALVALDASQPLTPEDRRLLRATRGRARVVVANKADLPAAFPLSDLPHGAGREAVRVSARTGEGLGALEERVARALAGPPPDLDGPVVFTVRQKEAVSAALEALRCRPPRTEEASHRLRELAGG